MPCRAQGRPIPRIIWDRIGNSAVSQLHHHHTDSKITQYLDEETQEDLLAKAKIMSFRSKRSLWQANKHPKATERTIDNSALIFNQSVRRMIFNQIMRKEDSREIHRLHRKRRQILTNSDQQIDATANDEHRSPDAIPILVFSTQAPQEVSRLHVNDNGELILLDVTERDQVRNNVFIDYTIDVYTSFWVCVCVFV